MKLVVLRVGKARNAWADEACADYGRRIRRHLPLEEIVLPTATAAPDLARAREGEALVGQLKDRDRLVVLDPGGQQITTDALAELVTAASQLSTARLVLAIGGPFGHGAAARERAWKTVALSRLILNHELARVVVYEQLYRVTDILWGGRVYHH
jgi:23S rRNA (pseudouridine1915-N3)-methyltransferase